MRIGGDNWLDSVNLTNSGTIEQNGLGAGYSRINTLGSVLITNNKTWRTDLNTGSSLTWNDQPAFVFQNNDLLDIRLSSDYGFSIVGQFRQSATGRLLQSGGLVRLDNNAPNPNTYQGEITVAPGGTLDFYNGRHQLLSGPQLTAANLRIAGATFTADRSVDIDRLTVDGSSVTFHSSVISPDAISAGGSTLTFNDTALLTVPALSLGGSTIYSSGGMLLTGTSSCTSPDCEDPPASCTRTKVH